MSMLDASPTDPAMDPATVLEEAADLLLIRGRCTGMGESDGRYCVLGGLAEVAGRSPLLWGEMYDHPAVIALAAHLEPRLPWIKNVETVTHNGEYWANTVCWLWNDGAWPHPSPDDFEVIDTLRLVAKDLRNAASGDAGAHDATRGEVGQ